MGAWSETVGTANHLHPPSVQKIYAGLSNTLPPHISIRVTLPTQWLHVGCGIQNSNDIYLTSKAISTLTFGIRGLQHTRHDCPEDIRPVSINC